MRYVPKKSNSITAVRLSKDIKASAGDYICITDTGKVFVLSGDQFVRDYKHVDVDTTNIHNGYAATSKVVAPKKIERTHFYRGEARKILEQLNEVPFTDLDLRNFIGKNYAARRSELLYGGYIEFKDNVLAPNSILYITNKGKLALTTA